MSSGDAKTYLSKRNVPGLFECLMTGLMFHRPTDHIQYLIDCLEKVKAKGQEDLRWNMFIEMQRSKTPLPPITPTNGRRPISRERSITPKEEKLKETLTRTPTPLPPIGDKGIPDVPIVFLVGGPGSGKSTQVELLLRHYPGWVTVAVGELLRQEVAARGTADAKWKMVNELMSTGEMVPEDVVDTLLVDKLRASHNADGFIIQGFPRDMEQATQYDKMVGRVDAVFLLDCEEETLSKQLLERAKDTRRIDNNVNTVAKRIQAFKEKTLPVLKHYDDMEKLFILEGEKEVKEIAEDLLMVFEVVVGTKGKVSPVPTPPKEPKPERARSARSGKTTPQKSRSPEPSTSPQPKGGEAEELDLLPVHLLPPEITVKDEGRKPDMPQAPIIFVAGGPGSGKGTQCKRLLSRYTDAVHLSMGDILRNKISTEGTADDKWDMVTDLLRQGDLAPEEMTVELLTKALKDKPDAHFYLVEGFPRNLEQLHDFNKQIGGQGFTILLDCEEDILHWRLTVRGKESERIDDNLVAIGKKLTFFKNNTLPILKTIDDSGKLVVVSGDRDEDEITFDLCKILDFAIYGKLPEHSAAAESKKAPQAAGEPTPSEDQQKGTTAVAAKEETSPAEGTAAEDGSKTTESKDVKAGTESAADPAAEASGDPPTDITARPRSAKLAWESSADTATEGSAEPTAKPAEQAASKTEETEAPSAETANAKDEVAGSEENLKEEASKTEGDIKMGEENPKEDDLHVEDVENPKTDGEASKTEGSEDVPEVQSPQKEATSSEDTAKAEETAKPEDEAKTEVMAESPKADTVDKPAEAEGSDEAPKAEDTSAAVVDTKPDETPTEGTTAAPTDQPDANASRDASEEKKTTEDAPATVQENQGEAAA